MKIEFNYEQMYNVCMKPESWFEQFGTWHDTGDGQQYIFQDNNANVLLVAHLDSVAGAHHFIRSQRSVKFHGTYRPVKTVETPTLDDRIGAYLILYVLKEHLGNNYDILLTTGEESGSSTAKDFIKSELAGTKRWNWFAEFDRMFGANDGTDCALYQYMSPEWVEVIKRYGWTPVQGSYTDIVDLSILGVKGMNVCVAYEDYHSERAWVNLPSLAENTARFIRFFRDNKDTKFPHTHVPTYKGTAGTRGYYNNWFDDEYNFPNTSASHLRGTMHNRRFDDSNLKGKASGISFVSNPQNGTKPKTWTEDYSWMTDKDVVKTTINLNEGTSYTVYHQMRNKFVVQSAAHCAGCNLPFNIEHMVFPSGIPLCPSCFIDDAKLTEDDHNFVDGGGILILDYKENKLSVTRTSLATDSALLDKCDICEKLNLKTDLKTVHINGIHIQKACPECRASIESPDTSIGGI